MPRKINGAVIGYGPSYNMGRLHLLAMERAGMMPYAVVARSAAHRRAAALDFPAIKIYANAEEMLAESDADLVIVNTPHSSHASLALQCIEAGRNVVCEKPFAITTQECDAIIAAASAKNVMVSAFHNRHWDGSILKALDVIRGGVIGDVLHVACHMGKYAQPDDNWRSSKSISGGILYDWGVHLLEYGLQLINAEIIEVTGFASHGVWAKQTKWQADTIEDDSFALVRFKNGASLTLSISNIDAQPQRGMVNVTGTKGTFWWDGENHEITIVGEHGVTTTRDKNPPDQWGNYYANIAAHLSNHAPLIITPEWARRPVHILDLAHRSALVGHSLKAQYQ